MLALALCKVTAMLSKGWHYVGKHVLSSCYELAAMMVPDESIRVAPSFAFPVLKNLRSSSALVTNGIFPSFIVSLS